MENGFFLSRKVDATTSNTELEKDESPTREEDVRAQENLAADQHIHLGQHGSLQTHENLLRGPPQDDGADRGREGRCLEQNAQGI